MNNLTKAQALEIFIQLAEAYSAKPAEHRLIRAAYDVLAALPEPPPASVTATDNAAPPESATKP